MSITTSHLYTQFIPKGAAQINGHVDLKNALVQKYLKINVSITHELHRKIAKIALNKQI